jgi:VIT1/CCC1 family predicted Fe2+/Mn2+ transporter
MAMGEWISVTSSRELYQRELAVERREIAEEPAAEYDELVELYTRQGLGLAAARVLADHVMADPDRALEVMAREELGIDPDKLGGSAVTAALSSFTLFVAGAVVPVAPFTVLSGTPAVIVSVAASALALFGVGVLITRVTGRAPARSGVRQLVIGLAAAAVTFGTGVLLGVSIG